MLPMDAIQAIFKIFPVLGRHDFQHHTGKKRLDPRQQDKATGDQCRESGHQTGIQIFQEDRYEQDCGNNDQ